MNCFSKRSRLGPAGRCRAASASRLQGAPPEDRERLPHPLELEHPMMFTWVGLFATVCASTAAAEPPVGLLAEVQDPAVKAALAAVLGRLGSTESELAAAEKREAVLLGRVGELERVVGLGMRKGDGAERAWSRYAEPTMPSQRPRKQSTGLCDFNSRSQQVMTLCCPGGQGHRRLQAQCALARLVSDRGLRRRVHRLYGRLSTADRACRGRSE